MWRKKSPMKETAYLLQAVLISAWGVGMATHETFFLAFQFNEMPPAAFWAFFGPGLVLIASASFICSYRKLPALEYVILAAFGIATLYCANASFRTASGYLSTGLILMGLAYNAFACFNQSLFHTSSSSLRRNILKTSVQVICIWSLTLVIIPCVLLDAFDNLAMPKLSIWQFVGFSTFCCASLLGLTSSFFLVRDGAGTPLPLDQTNHLVMSGPYHFVRNPMAIAGIGQGISVAIIFQSIAILVYSVLGALVWQLVVRPIEENDLLTRFGKSYLDYRQRVSCWIPTFKLFR